MAEVVELSNLTLNNEEARSTSEVIFEKTIESPELSAVHRVDTDVDMDKFIPIVGELGLVGKADPGGCATNEITEVIPVSEKTWEPKLISGRLPICATDIPAKIKFWKRARQANKTWEEIDNEYMAFVEDQGIKAVHNSIIRHTEFGDKTASPFGDATGNQTLTVGTDKTFFNVINGMWEQVEADLALAPNNEGYHYSITENGLATTALQLVLAADRALKAMRALYENIDPVAFEGNLVFAMTRTMFNNWTAFLEDQSLAFMLTQAESKGGVSGFSYRGIPIVVRLDWDKTIKTYYNNGTTLHYPHRIILADIDNLPVGTRDSESLKDFSAQYDFVTKKWYMDFAYTIDMKILLESQIAYAL